MYNQPNLEKNYEPYLNKRKHDLKERQGLALWRNQTVKEGRRQNKLDLLENCYTPNLVNWEISFLLQCT
eukprot:snap_masked-scaffold_17-processed-gene-1.21-mRNA-1 protein AED:1.00 eAED:1.00 QI:0/-1/0/0/-1/1/1/0/68